MDINLLFKILLVIFAYILGSLPNAFILFKFQRGGDIREHGSGNVGGTNVLRSAGPSLAVSTIILDIIKGIIPIVLLYYFFPSSYILFVITTFAVLIGHVFSVFLKFKGGKGVSTTGGLIIAVCVFEFSAMNIFIRITPAIVIVLTVLIIFFITRVMSLGSVIAALITPIMFFVCRYDLYIIIASILWTLVIIVSHRDNIKRLLKGEEKKILRRKRDMNGH